MSTRPTLDIIRRAPKVVLHEHLDGGLRPTTVIELSKELGVEGLPSDDPDEVAAWFVEGANQRDLVRYLDGFAQTVPLMQTREHLTRIAREAAEDLAADGVVYAEIRFAPELHRDMGLSLDEIVESVVEGLHQGSGETLTTGVIVAALRQAALTLEMAELATKHRDNGVVGFDIAGPEAGFPPSRHLAAFQHCQRESFPITIHAGEAFGLPSIHEALAYCNAERLGHGVRVVDDITIGEDGVPVLGRIATWIRDRRVPLEMCPWSNVHTGAAASIEQHPIRLLRELQFRVTVNTDNRLMSGTSMTKEFATLVDVFGYDLDDIRWLTINGMKSAFWPFDDRLRIINEQIKPGYEALAAEMA